jgi:hypothetical protein
MSDFDDLLERLLLEPQFKAELAAHPDRALAGYRLDAEERSVLLSQVAADSGPGGRVEERISKAGMAGLLSALHEVSTQGVAMPLEQAQTAPVSTAGGEMAVHLSSSVEARGMAVVHPIGVAQLADHQQVHTGTAPVHAGGRLPDEELRHKQSEELKQHHLEELKHKETEELKQRHLEELKQRHAEELKQKQTEELKQGKQIDGLQTKQAGSGLETKQTLTGLETKQTTSGLDTKQAPTEVGLKQPMATLETKQAASGLGTKQAASGLNTKQAPTEVGLKQPMETLETRQAASGLETKHAPIGDAQAPAD